MEDTTTALLRKGPRVLPAAPAPGTPERPPLVGKEAAPAEPRDSDPAETAEWVESLDALIEGRGAERAGQILKLLLARAASAGIRVPGIVSTPYVNTIAPAYEPPYPGDEAIEARIESYLRWNAAAMVCRANHDHAGLGGHLATYASAATLYEVGFHHFFRGKDDGGPGDQIVYQGHASPGLYARAFLEGRLTEEQLLRFRREAAGPGLGLSSYPHPRLMPDFWEFPSVSMGLGPIAAIYQARFNRYLEARGIIAPDRSRVWCFVGDGECDEPESLGALHVAAREGLDNLIFVVNCNGQRLDGPVRGNGKIIQELESIFGGNGWNVIKVIWGRDWDPLLDADPSGLLARRLGEVVDGEWQKYVVEGGAYIRPHLFGKDPRLAALVEHLSEADLARLTRGGHDRRKIFAAYRRAVEPTGRPTAILANTVKGYCLGDVAEGKNTAHQAKKLSDEDLARLRDRLGVPVPDDRLAAMPFLRFPDGSAEQRYLTDRRKALGGPLPKRVVREKRLEVPPLGWFKPFLDGTGKNEASTTAAFARLLAQLLTHEGLGRRVVPIVADEARTFGLDALFAKHGIYSRLGQLYEPVDRKSLLYYREAKDGQILEEGITEAGAMASFAAAATAYATHGEPMIPFYIFYSMFGFQRTGDQVWSLADQRGRGFLLGATAGRTTLNGEGLQHGDGHSPILYGVVPNVRAYDPAFAFEVAVIIQDGLRRMLEAREDTFYYITLQNEAYPMPPLPEGAEQGILDGLYLYARAPGEGRGSGERRVRLLGSGSILREVLRAQAILAGRFGVAADVYSATSYLALRRDALACERWNLYHPETEPRVPRIRRILGEQAFPTVAATDYIRAVPDQIGRWVPGGLLPLGTDGFGRSDTRAALRRHFEVDAEAVAVAALHALARSGRAEPHEAADALRDLGVDPEKMDPAEA